MHCNVYEMLIAKKNVIEAAVEDAKHDLYTYEFIQKNLRFGCIRQFAGWSQKFTPAVEKLINNETSEFGRQLTRAVYALIMEICSRCTSVIN